VALSYEALAEVEDPRPGPPVPRAAVLEIDASLYGDRDGSTWLVATDTSRMEEALRIADHRLAHPTPVAEIERRDPARPVTSLPREAYCTAVRAVLERIFAGDVYQANLTQMFSVEYPSDPGSAWSRLAEAAGAPRAAYFADGAFALASVSPEIFMDVDRDGGCTTWPIKGTRRRHADPELDRRAAVELAASEKDLAELVMIVDLERNDLSRVSRVGSVCTGPIPELRSYPAVHHLVARVNSRLLPGTGIEALLDATFPGGSITGAPKESAMRILAGLEPCLRGPFTGSLLWLGDDGSLASSILIRSVVFARGRAWLGAGGGVVADSDPESEWRESNDKARAIAGALGFAPEDAR